MNSSNDSAATRFPFPLSLSLFRSPLPLPHTQAKRVSFAVNEREKIYGISSRGGAKQSGGKLF